MMFSIVVIAAIIAVASAQLSLNATLAKVNPAVTSLDVSKYLGLWYQMYADQVVISSFEKGTYCSTALYGQNGDGTLSVHNYAAQDSPSGSPYVIDGFAYYKDPKKPGELLVHFDSSDAFPFDAPYWVIELGPVVNGKYDYAIVSDNLSAFLFVLARNPTTFRSKYQADVLSHLTAMGFTGISKPIETYQKADCKYEAAIRADKIRLNAEKQAGAATV